MHRACDVSVAGLQSRYASPDITPTCKEKEKRWKKRFVSCKTGGRAVLCAARRQGQGACFCLLPHGSDAAEKKGLRVMGSDGEKLKPERVGLRHSGGGSAEAANPRSPREDHCVRIRKAILMKIVQGFFFCFTIVNEQSSFVKEDSREKEKNRCSVREAAPGERPTERKTLGTILSAKAS